MRSERRTMVFYEAPHKLPSTLEDMLEAWGDRRIALVREISKIHEEVQRTTLRQAAAYYRENTPKGEFVLVIEGAKPEEPADELTLEQAVLLAETLMEQGCPASEAAKQAAQASPFKKGEIYRLLVERRQG